MLTIIAGEDATSSREYQYQLKKSYAQKGFYTENIPIDQIEQIAKDDAPAENLFGQSTVYFVDSLSKKYKGRQKTAFKEAVISITKNSKICLVDWENGKSAYELSGLKKIATEFREFKPKKNIFELLESCYPGNLENFLSCIEIVSKSQEPTFIYAMLCKHVRKLIFASEDALDAKTQPWQRQKLYIQAGHWNKNNLMKFYEGLAKIDTAVKTSSTPYDLKSSLELLVCYYLK